MALLRVLVPEGSTFGVRWVKVLVPEGSTFGVRWVKVLVPEGSTNLTTLNAGHLSMKTSLSELACAVFGEALDDAFEGS
jgi:hypothetical protein